MATNNFHFKNTKQVYAIEDIETDDWEVSEMYWEDKELAIKEDLEKLGFDVDLGTIWLDRDSRILGSKEVWNKKGKRLEVNGYWGYKLKAVIRAGYYSGANLDWELVFMNYNGTEMETFDCTDILEDLDYLFGEYWLGGNKEKREKFAKMIEKEIKRKLDKDIKELEKVYKQHSIVLNHKGSFSNGEAIYEIAK